MKISVLSIGTELVEGQTINRNAPWISTRLKKQGVPTSLHFTVPDDARLMHEGLELCARESDVIFVTGGLGPTSDDFTRDIVAAWLGEELEFHEPSWLHLTERLTSRGYTVKEIQRQQCYFPRGAKVLSNSQGTANAFYAENQGKKIFVLPGPPREIAAVWEDHVEAWLASETANLDPLLTRSWDTLGQGESDIAVKVEEVLKGVEVEKGYRVHLPYVEVKLTFRRSEEVHLRPFIEAVDRVLADVTISRDGADVAEILGKKLATQSVAISDTATGSFLFHRLSPFLRETMSHQSWSFGNVTPAADTSLRFSLRPLGPLRCEASLESKGQKVTEVMESPYKTSNMHERTLQYFAERALIFWLKNSD